MCYCRHCETRPRDSAGGLAALCLNAERLGRDCTRRLLLFAATSGMRLAALKIGARVEARLAKRRMVLPVLHYVAVHARSVPTSKYIHWIPIQLWGGGGGSMLKGPYFYGPRSAKLGVLFVTHAKKSYELVLHTLCKNRTQGFAIPL